MKHEVFSGIAEDSKNLLLNTEFENQISDIDFKTVAAPWRSINKDNDKVQVLKISDSEVSDNPYTFYTSELERPTWKNETELNPKWWGIEYPL